MRPMTTKATNAPPGPAWEIVAPEARKSPVPIAPPMAIMFMWRESRPRWSSSWDSDATSLGGCWSLDELSIEGTATSFIDHAEIL